MPPVDPLAVPAVRLGAPPQLVAVAGIDEEDFEPLGLEQFVQGDPVDAGRFQGDRGDLVLTQEGRNGFQASRVGRELPNQTGTGFGGEADADPVRAGTDVDAGGVRVLHGQGLDLGGLPLPQGFALDLGPGLATAVGLGLIRLAAGSRGGGWWVSGRRFGHGRTPQKRKGEGIGGRTPRRCAGESAGRRSRLQAGTTRSRDGVTGSGSPVMGPKTLPDSESDTGKTPGSLTTIRQPESRHTPPRLKIARPRFLRDGVLAQRE